MTIFQFVWLTHEQRVPNLVSVLRCICRAITIFALCCAIGLQWLALQSIAWTAMIVDNAKHASLCKAIAQTFDGAHPCSLCQIVNNAKSTETKSDLQPLTPKIDMICVSRTTSFLQRFTPIEYAARDFSFNKLGRSPPAPPPRSILS
jgi:hypothetical protein